MLRDPDRYFEEAFSRALSDAKKESPRSTPAEGFRQEVDAEASSSGNKSQRD
jgi:hypothetical protein